MQLENGKIVEGKVTGITKFGAFVDLGEGKTGMVHISEVAPTFVKEITDFLKTLKGKEVFLFGTAGFGGSQEYFDKILSSVQKHLGASNTVIGTYMCQGKMPQSVRERYVKMKNSPLPIPNVDKLIENFDTAVSHPDETDLQKLKYAVAQCIKR